MNTATKEQWDFFIEMLSLSEAWVGMIGGFQVIGLVPNCIGLHAAAECSLRALQRYQRYANREI